MAISLKKGILIHQFMKIPMREMKSSDKRKTKILP